MTSKSDQLKQINQALTNLRAELKAQNVKAKAIAKAEETTFIPISVEHEISKKTPQWVKNANKALANINVKEEKELIFMKKSKLSSFLRSVIMDM